MANRSMPLSDNRPTVQKTPMPPEESLQTLTRTENQLMEPTESFKKNRRRRFTAPAAIKMQIQNLQKLGEKTTR